MQLECTFFRLSVNRQMLLHRFGKRAKFRHNDKTCIWESGEQTITSCNVKDFCMFNGALYKMSFKGKCELLKRVIGASSKCIFASFFLMLIRLLKIER